MDTNVVVSGMTSADPHSPPSRILDAMLDGRLLYLMSGALLSEYAAVLRRPGVARFHQQTEDEIDSLLTDLAANAVWREPSKSEAAPERGDNHLWPCSQASPVVNSSQATGRCWRTLRGLARSSPPATPWMGPNSREDS